MNYYLKVMKKHFYKEEIAEYCLYKHLTVDEIFNYINQKFPQAGRSTVYRNVEELVKEGKLKKIAGAGNKLIYEGKITPHAHLICRKTNTVTDIPFNKKFLKKLPKNFEVEDLDINVYGHFV